MGDPVLPFPLGGMKGRHNAFVLETPHTRSLTSMLAGEALSRRRGNIGAVYEWSLYGGFTLSSFPILPLPAPKKCPSLENSQRRTLF